MRWCWMQWDNKCSNKGVEYWVRAEECSGCLESAGVWDCEVCQGWCRQRMGVAHNGTDHVSGWRDDIEFARHDKLTLCSCLPWRSELMGLQIGPYWRGHGYMDASMYNTVPTMLCIPFLSYSHDCEFEILDIIPAIIVIVQCPATGWLCLKILLIDSEDFTHHGWHEFSLDYIGATQVDVSWKHIWIWWYTTSTPWWSQTLWQHW